MEVQIKGALSMEGCDAGGGQKQTKCMLGIFFLHYVTRPTDWRKDSFKALWLYV